MAEEKAKKSSGAGKFFLGAALGALAGVVAHKFASSKAKQDECDCDEECDCDGKDCDCDEDCTCRKKYTVAEKEPAKKSSEKAKK